MIFISFALPLGTSISDNTVYGGKLKNLRMNLGSFVEGVKEISRNIHFWILTIIGNVMTAVGALAFHYFEEKVNPNVNIVMDSVWWAFVTVTSVGYGDITPITFGGRVVGILLMLAGTTLFALYLALFAEIFIAIALPNLRRRKT